MYNYADEKQFLFTDKGQRKFLIIRDNVKRLLEDAGAFKMEKAWKGISGDTFHMMACVDRLVDLEEIKELTDENCVAQYRIFIAGVE